MDLKFQFQLKQHGFTHKRRLEKDKLQIQGLSMVADVIINEGGNEKVRVVITWMQPHQQWNIVILACISEVARQ